MILKWDENSTGRLVDCSCFSREVSFLAKHPATDDGSAAHLSTIRRRGQHPSTMAVTFASPVKPELGGLACFFF